jgi:CxxC-x17-CxxC domain-containing protein
VFEDRTLTCRDCGDSFIFSGGEQRFFAEKGLQNVSQRCPGCRGKAKRVSMGGARVYHAAGCKSGGKQAMVPLAPRTDRPVYCSTCFDKVRAGLIPAAAAPVSS